MNDADNFKATLKAGIANGFTIDQIKEIIMHLSVYCGFPRTVHAMLNLKEISKEMT